MAAKSVEATEQEAEGIILGNHVAQQTENGRGLRASMAQACQEHRKEVVPLPKVPRCRCCQDLPLALRDPSRSSPERL